MAILIDIGILSHLKRFMDWKGDLSENLIEAEFRLT